MKNNLIGLIDFEKDELSHFFPEIFKVSQNCRYNNCLHINEPDCAVREAVEKGEIFDSRYYSYLNLMEDKGNRYREK